VIPLAAIQVDDHYVDFADGKIQAHCILYGQFVLAMDVLQIFFQVLQGIDCPSLLQSRSSARFGEEFRFGGYFHWFLWG
jgi:hypothetical protein